MFNFLSVYSLILVASDLFWGCVQVNNVLGKLVSSWNFEMKYILHDLKILDKKIFSRPALWFELVTYSQVDSPVHQMKCAKHYWEDHPEKNICLHEYLFSRVFI